LRRTFSVKDAASVESIDSAELATFESQHLLNDDDGEPGTATTLESYERLTMNGRPYLCTIPHVERQVQNTTETKPSEAEQEKELVRATNRGRELLQDMSGKPCLFYTTGWWSYSFCYNSEVKQFHSLPPGQNGAPIWPPTEDPTTPTYILGRIDQGVQHWKSGDDEAKHEVVELQRKAETSYLVQRLENGTPCDLTGKDRNIEIQFHCNPQTTDRIGWIKETATCAYLMVIYTPRLCNDIAFLPPKESTAHPITCQEILRADEVDDWKSRKAEDASRRLIDDGSSSQRIIIGNVEVGGMKDVGREGKKIERGRVVLTTEEKAEIVVIQKDGRVEGLSKADLKKMDLNPEDVEAFTKELQRLAGAKDWKIERLDDVNGQIQLRGVVASESDDKDDQESMESEGQDEEEGSEEEYKEDI